MVAEARTWVDVEGAVRSWAREAMTGLSGRVFFGVPDQTTFPLVTLQRIAGPDDDVLIQFDVWAAKKAAAASTAADLASAVDALGRYATADVLLLGAAVLGVRWEPDVESDQPRYIVEATFTAVSAVPFG